jgi:hypothetical protein
MKDLRGFDIGSIYEYADPKRHQNEKWQPSTSEVLYKKGIFNCKGLIPQARHRRNRPCSADPHEGNRTYTGAHRTVHSTTHPWDTELTWDTPTGRIWILTVVYTIEPPASNLAAVCVYPPVAVRDLASYRRSNHEAEPWEGGGGGGRWEASLSDTTTTIKSPGRHTVLKYFTRVRRI